MIETTRSKGTGFLVLVGDTPDQESPLVLVTNKHVVGHESAIRYAGQELSIHANVATDRTAQPLPIRSAYTPADYREHPNPAVDICAMQMHFVGDEVILSHRCLFYKDFANRDQVLAYGISPGDELLIVGYPLGFLQGVTNSPIIRHGILATSLLDDLAGPVLLGRTGSLPAFIVDGGALPGSSGSPVFLKPAIGRVFNGKAQLDPPPALLLGILAETRIADVPSTSVPASESFAGLGMAYRADAIRETLDLFLA